MEDKQQFPKWMYGPDGAAKIVHDATEMDALTGWAESPGDVGKAAPKKRGKE